MKSLNAHQEMVRSMKVFIATATDAELTTKKELLLGLVASRDHEIAKAATKCLHLVEEEIQDRK
jgi:hypothetical protein